MPSLIDEPGYKPHFSGHETFPLRQMWLKKAHDHAVRYNSLNKKPFSDESCIAALGVGKNMVASIRHWSVACKMLDDKSLTPTRLGRFLLADGQKDPFMEMPGTTWLAHWHLAGVGDRSTTWYWMFNRVTTPTFKRDDLLKPLTEYAERKTGKAPAATTLKRDIETCVRSYVPQAGSDSPEDFAEPMLGELDLVMEVEHGVFAFRRGPKITLPDEIFAYALIEYWEHHAASVSSIAFERIAYEDGSPGRVFKLDEDSVAERLMRLNELTNGKLSWSDSGGIRQVYRHDLALETIKDFLLGKYYG